MTLPALPFALARRLNVHDAANNDVAGPARLIRDYLNVEDQLTHTDKRTAATK